MRRTVLLRMPRKRMMLTLLAALLAFSVASVVTFVASLTNTPAASAQATPPPDTEDPSFSVRCDFSHRNYDDPIVYPGKQGAAHRHDFYGNKSTNHQSTLETLLAADTTCLHPEDTSAYWTPTLWWNSSLVKASRAVFYYRADYKDPKVPVEAYPPGLKIVPNSHVTWRCEGTYTYTTVPPKQCKEGLGVRIVVPDCLAKDTQGRPRTDSADHRSHMAYSTRNSATGYNDCPTTHPISVPEMQMVIKYPTPTTRGTVKLSSGDASTMHADFFNAWDQPTLEGLVKDCINTLWPEGQKPAKCNNRTETEAQTAQASLAAGPEDQSQVTQQKKEKSQELLQEEEQLKQEEEELKKRDQEEELKKQDTKEHTKDHT